jgi:hypothetical protein
MTTLSEEDIARIDMLLTPEEAEKANFHINEDLIYKREK